MHALELQLFQSLLVLVKQKHFFLLKICRRHCRFSSSNASSWSLNQLGSLHNCSAASTHKQHTNSIVETQILVLTPVVSLAVGHSQRSTFACQPLSPHALQLCMDQRKTSFWNFKQDWLFATCDVKKVSTLKFWNPIKIFQIAPRPEPAFEHICPSTLPAQLQTDLETSNFGSSKTETWANVSAWICATHCCMQARV